MTVITMSRTEIDRMRVLHDLADGRIRAAEASTLMGLGRRQVFRLAKAYGKHGPQALVSRRRGRPSNRAAPASLRAEVLGVIKERYSDFGPTPAAEKLAELHGIHLARETLRQWMIAAGLWKDRRARLKPVHQPRYRRDRSSLFNTNDQRIQRLDLIAGSDQRIDFQRLQRRPQR
jgi:hypothetical protein